MRDRKRSLSMDMYVARTLGLMNHLVMNGFPCKKVEDSYKNPSFKVFLFERTEELEKVAETYVKEKSMGD